jgi:hypothetical protein
VDEHQAVMLKIGVGVLTSDRFEIDAVIGNYGSTLPLCRFEEVRITQPTQAWLIRGRDDIVAALAKAIRDLATDLLVEK